MLKSEEIAAGTEDENERRLQQLLSIVAEINRRRRERHRQIGLERRANDVELIT